MTVDRNTAVEPLLLSAVEAASLCGVSRSHWLALHSSGRTPLPLKLGNRTLWSREELREWTKAGCPSREKWLSIKGTQNA
jgi:predicted DNA-binding transcriptional regulator AlpA